LAQWLLKIIIAIGGNNIHRNIARKTGLHHLIKLEKLKL